MEAWKRDTAARKEETRRDGFGTGLKEENQERAEAAV